MQLAVEDPDMAERYEKKSLAEQNSLDLSWDLLMEDQFASLRRYLFASEEELLRFRQLIVNIVLATVSAVRPWKHASLERSWYLTVVSLLHILAHHRIYSTRN